MKVTTILSVVSAKLRALAENLVEKPGAEQTIFGQIRLIDEQRSALLEHYSDSRIVQRHQLIAVILNIAEPLVVAARSESAAQGTRR